MMLADKPFPWHFLLLWICAVAQSGSGLGPNLNSNVIESRTKTTETTVYSEQNEPAHHPVVQSQRIQKVLTAPPQVNVVEKNSGSSSVFQKKTTVLQNGEEHLHIPKETATIITNEKVIPTVSKQVIVEQPKSERIQHQTTHFVASNPAVQYQTQFAAPNPAVQYQPQFAPMFHQPQMQYLSHVVPYPAPQMFHMAPAMYPPPQMFHAAPAIYPAYQPSFYGPTMPSQASAYYVDSSGIRSPLPRFQGQMNVPDANNFGHSRSVTRELTFYVDPNGFLRALPESGISNSPHFPVNTIYPAPVLRGLNEGQYTSTTTSINPAQTRFGTSQVEKEIIYNQRPIEQEIIYNRRPVQEVEHVVETKINPGSTRTIVNDQSHVHYNNYVSNTPEVVLETRTNPGRTERIIEEIYHDYPNRDEYHSSSPQVITKINPGSSRTIVEKTIHEYPTINNQQKIIRSRSPEFAPTHVKPSSHTTIVEKIVRPTDELHVYNPEVTEIVRSDHSGYRVPSSSVTRTITSPQSSINNIESHVINVSDRPVNRHHQESENIIHRKTVKTIINDYDDDGIHSNGFKTVGSNLNDIGSVSTSRRFTSGRSGLNDLGSTSTIREFSSGGPGLNDFGSGSTLRGFSSGGSGLNDFSSSSTTSRFSSGGSGFDGVGSGSRIISSGNPGLNNFGSSTTRREFSSGGSGLDNFGSSSIREFSSGGSTLNDFGPSSIRRFRSGGSGLNEFGSGSSSSMSRFESGGSSFGDLGSGSTRRFSSGSSGLNPGGSHFTSSRVSSF